MWAVHEIFVPQFNNILGRLHIHNLPFDRPRPRPRPGLGGRKPNNICKFIIRATNEREEEKKQAAG